MCVRAHKFLLPPDRSASPPIISFRETITARGEAVEAATADRQVTLRVRAEPLGAALTEMVSDAIAVAIAAAAEMGDATTRGSGGSAAALRDGAFILFFRTSCESNPSHNLTRSPYDIFDFAAALRALPPSAAARATLPADEVWALAPSHAGPCVLRASAEVQSIAAALLVANGLLAGAFTFIYRSI